MHACSFMNGWGGPRRTAALCAVGVSLALAACDPQASPEFEGLSLLTIRGSVTLADDHTNGELVPALAFANPETGEVEIVDVGAQGEFPSDFRIDVFKPPSQAALRRLTDFGPNEPRLALGYITAVTPDHPDSFFYATTGSSEVRPSGCDGCVLECDPVRGCATKEEWCSDEEGTHCYSETTICPEPDSAPEDCRIEKAGDPTLKEPAWRFFAGLSQNYAIAYLAEPAAEGSGTAATLGAKGSLKAGYHLLGVLESSEELLAESQACGSRADLLAVDHYNEAHDTQYTLEQLENFYCLSSAPCAEDSPECVPTSPSVHPACALSEAELETVYDDYRVAGQRARVELGCLLSPFFPIEKPSEAAISILIGPDSQPGF